MADNKRQVFLIPHPDPVQGLNLAKQVEDYFYGTYRIHTSTKSDHHATNTNISQFPHDPSRPNLVAAPIDNGLGQRDANVPDEGRLLPTQQPAANQDDDKQNPSFATFNDESQRAVENHLYEAAVSLQPTVLVKGKRETQEVMTLIRFLRLNSVPYSQIEQDPPKNAKKVQVTLQIPFENEQILDDPTLITLSTQLKLMSIDTSGKCDVAVVGGGPAGLSAAVNLVALYGKTPLIIEQFAPGGEAATATNIILNYLGFPDGIEAAELAARWKKHADKLNISWLPDYRVTDVVLNKTDEDYPFTLTVAQNNRDRDSAAIYDEQVLAKDKKEVAAKKILLACGINFRKQGGEDEDKYAGQGVYYSVLTKDVEFYKANDTPVAIIGSGDTAAAAAIMFAKANVRTIMIVRALKADMLPTNYEEVEKYLDKPPNLPVIQVLYQKEVMAYRGNDDGCLNKLVIGPTGTTTHEKDIDVAAAYVLIGAKGLDLTTQKWLKNLGVKYDDKLNDGVETHHPTGKPPCYNMTNVRGVFVAGDARAGNVRRISEAVGDGGSAALGIYNDFNQI